MLAAVVLSLTACAAEPTVSEGAAAVTISNISAEDAAIAAVYDGSNTLIGAGMYKNEGSIDISYDDILDKYPDAGYLKLFVWKENMEPQMTAYGIDLTRYKDEAGRYITLNSGYSMPVLGLGTWTQNDETTASSVYCALKDGYRLIDTAQYYGNEKGVGDGVRRAMDEGIVKREDVFITSKVMPMNYDNAYASIGKSNEKIGLGYIDLMLIHQSGSNDKQVYRALEQAVKDGTIRSLGISNYYTPSEFDAITEGAQIMPAVIQNENHPFYQNTALQEYVKQYGTVVESYYPLGGRGHTQDLLGNDTIKRIAAAHSKTAAQIILRWHIEAGYITIPGSSNPDHIAENYSIFDFELTDEEMQAIAALDTGSRYELW